MPESRYSIAVCNYNMAETLEASLRSMLDQVGRDFEVVVVDGGSTDGSRDILRRLEEEYDQLRAILDRADESNHLGGDRNISFEESRGDYVLESMDTDDRYYEGIVDDFVRIFHAIEAARDDPFFLSGRGINMAPRDLLLRVPYYDLGGAEDRDLWRRLIAEDALVWFDHGAVADQLGYEPDLRAKIQRDIEGKICDFRSGISFASALRWTFHHEHYYILERRRSPPLEFLKRCYDLVTLPYAYLVARTKSSHPAPAAFRSKGSLERWIAEHRQTLPELENRYGFEIDRESLSDAGRQAFLEYP